MRQLTFLGPKRLQWMEVPEPRIEEDADALVRPIAATTCDLDQMILRGETPFHPPLAIGHECVAEVVAIGPGVHSLHRGQVVAVPWHVSCWSCDRCRAGLPTACRETRGAMYGLPVAGDWGSMFSDLLRVPHAAGALVPLPAGVQAAAGASLSDNLPAAWDATVPYLRQRPGADVLIVGGCGSIALYAVAFAAGGGAAQVDYLDTDPRRLELAGRLGATVIDASPPERMGRSYDLAVDASAHDDEGLRCALRSLRPGGTCTTVGLYFRDVDIPLFDMFTRGVTFHAGKSNARPAIPEVLDLICAARIDPAQVTSEVIDWEDIPEALVEPSMKPVFVREPLIGGGGDRST